MSFFLQNSAASQRSRRTRDKDGNGRASSISSHRRSKDYSKTRDERSPPPKPSTPSTASSSIYTQQNLALEKLPEPSKPGSGSPKSPTSPVLKAGTQPATTGVYHLPFQIHTPAALQSYLESGDDSDEDEDSDDDEDEDEGEDEGSVTRSEPARMSTDVEKDKRSQQPERLTQVDKTPTKHEVQKKNEEPPQNITPKKVDVKSIVASQSAQEELTPQPKPPASVASSQDDRKMPGQFPFPQDEYVQPQAAQKERPKMSASSVSLQDLPRQQRDSVSSPSSSPHPLSRSTSNIETLPASLHERAFTPPAPAQGIVPNRGSPAFISPLPVRPAFINHHIPPYQAQSGQMSPPMHHLEMNPAPPPMTYYMHQQAQRPPLAFLGGRNPSSSETIVWDQQQQVYQPASPAQHPEQYYQPQSQMLSPQQLPLQQQQPHYQQQQHEQYVPQQEQHTHHHEHHHRQRERHHQHPQQLPSPPPTSPPQPSPPEISPRQRSVDLAIEPPKSPEDEDETVLMLRRIQAVLPDFHTLLNCYHDTSHRLGIENGGTEAGKEKSIKLIENSKIHETEESRLRETEKDRHIEALLRELDNVKHEHVLERNKMRLLVGNLEEDKRALAEDNSRLVQTHDEAKKEAQASKEQLTALETSTTQEKRAFEARIATLEDQLNVKMKAELAFTATLMAKDDAAKKEMERLSTQLSEDRERRDDSISRLSTQLADEKKRFEETVSKLRSDKDATIKARDIELEKSSKAHSDAKDAWRKERDVLTRDSEKKCKEVKIYWEEHCRKLSDQHIKEREEVQKSWESSQQKQLKRNDHLEDDRDRLRKELDRTKSAWHTDKSKYSRTADEFRSMVMRLQSEHSTIQKMMEAVGEENSDTEPKEKRERKRHS